ncbi:glutamate synthase, partial [Lysobacter sp. 2RAB21]
NQISMPVGRKVYYSVNKPDGGLLQQGYAVSGLTMNLPDLPVSGDYTLFVDPESGESASSQVKLSVGQSADLQFGGAPHSFTAEAPGQNVYFKFDAQQGANVGIGIADLTIAGSNGAGATVYVYRADGSQVTSRGCSPSDNGCDVDLWNLAAGRYSVVVIPNSGAGVLNFSVSASLDAVHVLTPDVAKALTLSRRGENARLKFAANAGQSFAFGIASQTTMPSGRKVYYTVYRPDGTVLQQAYATGPATMNLYELPVSGEYMLFVDPESGETANMQVTLLTGQTAELQPGSAERSFSTQSPGQYGYIRFDAQQGANVGIGIGSLIISQGSATVYVDRANGSRVTSRGCSTDDNGCDLDLWNLEAGRYTVTVIPNVNTATMSFNAAVSLDAAHVLTPGSSLNLALARIGENARLRFSASAGESFAFSVSGQNTVPTGRRVYYTVYKPDGSVLQQSYTTTTLTMNIANVPVSGEYLLFVDPNSGEAV